MLEITTDKSIVIFCSYRTGSTALCDYLEKKHKLTNFDEVFHECVPQRFERFRAHISSEKKYVIKIMPDHMQRDNADLIQQLTLQSTLIKLSRRDVLQQIASFHVCCDLEKWHSTGDSQTGAYEVNLEPHRLEYSIDYILSNNKALDALPYKFDHEVDYEDLGHLESVYSPSTRPTNYQELLQHIKERLPL